MRSNEPCFKSNAFIHQLSLNETRIEKNLFKALEEALRIGFASLILAERPALDRHLKAKHKRCMGQSKVRALVRVEVNVTGCTLTKGT